MSLDSKGRLAIPTRYRDRLMEHCGGQLVCTIDKAGCLLLYPQPEWEQVEEEVARLPSFVARTRDLQRMFLGHASDCEMDGHGRILLPSMLRKYANIDKQVVMAGQGKKCELWDEEAWNGRCLQWRNETEEGEIPPELARLSI